MKAKTYLFIFALTLFHSLHADQSPTDQIAEGPSENRLAGITLNKASLADISSLYGKPFGTLAPQIYFWTQRESYEFSAAFAGDGKVVTSISVVGPHAPAKMARTGRGLKLNDDAIKLRKIYGQRVREENPPNGPHRIIVVWEDGVELFSEIGADGRIRVLSLQKHE